MTVWVDFAVRLSVSEITKAYTGIKRPPWSHPGHSKLHQHSGNEQCWQQAMGHVLHQEVYLISIRQICCNAVPHALLTASSLLSNGCRYKRPFSTKPYNQWLLQRGSNAKIFLSQQSTASEEIPMHNRKMSTDK